MTDKTDNAIFVREVERKVDELIAWIVVNSSDKKLALSHADFSDVRNNIRKIVGGDDILATELEPSEGGAQYINDNPAPWP